MEGPSRERVLLVGPYGSGKSHAWISLAKMLGRTHTEAALHVLDTDNAAVRMLEAVPHASEVFIHVNECYEWPDYEHALKAAALNAKPQDWLIVDMIDKAWQAVQDYFIDQVFGTTSERFFLEARKEGTKGSPLAGEFGVNWNVINKLYYAWYNKVIRWPGHVLACTPGDPVNRATDNVDTVNLYGKTGVKPRGQKHLGHGFHTVLLLGEDSSGRYFSTIKDRNREEVTHQNMRDFTLDYLKTIGHWTVA
jgi:hypothetical protein